jgi:hypothetical protein
MTSFGATNIVNHRGPQYTFTVQGQVYHLAGSLLPLEGELPQYLQLYFTEDAVSQRCSNFTDINPGIVEMLQRMLQGCNELVRTFESALERMLSDEFKLVMKADRRPPGEHERHFNVPEVDEVAVVISWGKSQGPVI